VRKINSELKAHSNVPTGHGSLSRPKGEALVSHYKEHVSAVTSPLARHGGRKDHENLLKVMKQKRDYIETKLRNSRDSVKL